MSSLDQPYEPKDRWRAIVDYMGRMMAALAGPGTGKTYGLLKRAQELVDKREVPPESIAYITFIRQIAYDFRKELWKQFPDSAVRRITISTLHSLALGLIRNQGARIGVTGHLEPLKIDSDDIRAHILREDLGELLATQGRKIGLRALSSVLRRIKKQWQEGVQEPVLREEDLPAVKAYSRLSGAFQAIDWDQLMVYANQICEEMPLLPKWLGSFEHFLIDEYQDFNPAEQRFLREITAGAKSVVVVGDDDQSLYSGRGASPQGIVNLVSAPEVDSVTLLFTHRCKNEVVKAANSFLRYMRNDPKQLIALSDGGSVRIKSLKSAKAEVELLTEYVASTMQRIPLDAPKREGLACLFPSWRVLKQYRKDFEKRGIVCSVRRTVQETDEGMIAEVMARFAVLRTQPLLERVLLRQFPDMKGQPERDVVNELLSRDCTVREAVRALAGNGHWGIDVQTAAQEYEEFLDALTSRNPEIICSCFDEVLRGVVKCDVSLVEEFLARAEENLEDAVEELLRRMFWVDADIQQNKLESPALELITMHGAKGLTRKYIVIPGCEDYWLPSRAAGADPEEQKRLFYVAITRATDEVLITYPRHRAPNDSLNLRKKGCGKLSRFARQLKVSEEWC